MAQAGIAKGSFYQYFADKEDLYAYLLGLLAEKKGEFFSLDHPDPQHVGIFAYLRWIAEMGVQFEQAYPELSRVGYRAFYLGEYPAAFTERTRQTASAFYPQLVELGKQQGEIAADVDTELAAFLFDTILSNLPAYLLQYMLPEEKSPAHTPGASVSVMTDISGQIVEILERGMGNRRE